MYSDLSKSAFPSAILYPNTKKSKHFLKVDWESDFHLAEGLGLVSKQLY